MSMEPNVFRELRRKTGLSRERLAREADISTSLLQKLELGFTKANPRASTVRALAEVFSRRLGIPFNTMLIALVTNTLPEEIKEEEQKNA